jgi:hypothetical protein
MPDAYDAGMTAAFDAERGTGSFTDALSGPDGTRDPSALMPVLDVYPDALSAPMPVDIVPVIIPPTPRPPEPAGVRAEPVLGPASGRSVATGRAPAAGRGQRDNRPAQTRSGQARPAPTGFSQGRPIQPGPARPVGPSTSTAPARQAAARPPAPPMSGPGRSTMTAADMSAMFRTLRSGQTGQIDRVSYQATHPQSTASGAPSAVAPAAPMASHYSQRGQNRNTARDQAAERRRVSATAPDSNRAKRGSSTWAVIVFFIVIAFATGLGQRAIDLFNELFNR